MGNGFFKRACVSCFRELLVAESIIEPVKDFVGQVGAVKIALALLIILVVAGYVLFFPKNAVLTVNVRALDGDALPGAEVVLSNADGEVAATEYADDGGVARFASVAPGDYTAAVDAGGGFKPATKSVSVASGAEESVAVEVERISSVTVTAGENPSFVPLSCEKKILFELKNAGASDEQVQLVADGGLKDFFSAPVVFVPAGGSNYADGTFLVSRGKQGDELKGRVRVKGTRNGVDFSFALGNAPRISVSPQTISGNAAPGGLIQQKIMVTNEGSEPVEITKDRIVVEGHYAGSYDWTYFEPRIEPGAKASWWIALRVPENAVGKLVGVVKIPLPCRTVTIDIDTNAKED